MYRTKDGEDIFIIDGHVHFWDASKANQKNVHGTQFIDCFYAYHSNLSPKDQLWPKEKFEKYDAETMYRDLFVDGPDDMAILQPTYLTDFYTHGFNTTERNSAMAKKHPDRFILNGTFDPRDGEQGLEALHALAERYKLKGLKLYTAEWKGESKGWKLSDKMTYRYLETAEKLGIKNVHVHKGPTILPLNRDAFDVADVDDAASSFQNLNFIVEHCGLPRLDDFCWIATQETNVYAGLAVALGVSGGAYFLVTTSSRSCCSGSARTRSCMAAITPSGRRAGWSRNSWTSSCRKTWRRKPGSASPRRRRRRFSD